jgi:hypothetical protein
MTSISLYQKPKRTQLGSFWLPRHNAKTYAGGAAGGGVLPSIGAPGVPTGVPIGGVGVAPGVPATSPLGGLPIGVGVVLLASPTGAPGAPAGGGVGVVVSSIELLLGCLISTTFIVAKNCNVNSVSFHLMMLHRVG